MAESAQRHVVIWWRRDQVLNLSFDLLVKTTSTPRSFWHAASKSQYLACMCVWVHAGPRKRECAFTSMHLSVL